jgi:hypothetical protein
MLTLTFDKALHKALTKRVAEYLHDTDQAIARRLERLKQGETITGVPEASALYEQALVMLVTEVLCNVEMAVRRVLGGEEDRLAGIVAQAVAKAIQARGQMDETRKERAS